MSNLLERVGLSAKLEEAKRSSRSLLDTGYFTPLQRQALVLHINGQSHTSIARTLGISPARVAKIVKSREALALLSEVSSLHRMELAALTGPAIETIRQQLENSNGTVALKAANMVLQSQGLLQEKESRQESAEDFIAKITQHSSGRFRAIEQRTTAVEIIPDGDTAERGYSEVYADPNRDAHEVDASHAPVQPALEGSVVH